jgi:hypothetical protein
MYRRLKPLSLENVVLYLSMVGAYCYAELGLLIRHYMNEIEYNLLN